MDNDWLFNFFEKCRIISNEEMQTVWANLLASEANSPGTYSKRTVAFLSTLDKTEAQLFTSLCGFNWLFDNEQVPMVFDYKEPIYNNQGINFRTLHHLDDIGLINFEVNFPFARQKLPKRTTMF